jgi:hypothetical protein
MATQKVGNVGLYLVNGIAGRVGTPGAPILHFSLLVNAVTGAITGHARQTQAVAPPSGDIPIAIKSGQLHRTTTGPAQLLVSLSGDGLVSFPPPAIGSYLAPFSASFALHDNWDGVGGWTLGTEHVENVPVKSD